MGDALYPSNTQGIRGGSFRNTMEEGTGDASICIEFQMWKLLLPGEVLQLAIYSTSCRKSSGEIFNHAASAAIHNCESIANADFCARTDLSIISQIFCMGFMSGSLDDQIICPDCSSNKHKDLGKETWRVVLMGARHLDRGKVLIPGLCRRTQYGSFYQAREL
ncbi:hypothetical protein TNCV_924051 [Trichonephila clavipes]|nr:hypothetical protein TNCV_924051 [Trichonephila clavipes]